MITAFLFLAIFVFYCQMTVEYRERHQPKYIQDEHLLDKRGYPLNGAALQSRLKKLLKEGYVMGPEWH